MSLEREDPGVSSLGAIAGRCPRCGKGRLFRGFLTLAPRCGSCGLDFAFADPGDGPAVFATLIVGFIVVGLALGVEVLYEPPLWLHFGVFLPLVIALGILVLRPLKGLMIARQYQTRAEEGRLVR